MRSKLGTGITFLLVNILFWGASVTSFYQALLVEHSSGIILVNGFLGVVFLIAASCLTFVIAYFVGEGFKDER